MEEIKPSTKNYREAAVQRLGGCCQSPDCKWINDDGTRGCTDLRCLQIDHKDGGGSKERKKEGSYSMYKKMLADAEVLKRYQLLCANCNWIKRNVNSEFSPGRVMHHEFRHVEKNRWEVKLGETWVPYTKQRRKATVAGK